MQSIKKPLLLLVFLLLFSAFGNAQEEDYIFPSLTAEDLIEALQNDYSVTTSLSYNSARDYMFEDFDLIKEGFTIRGVYSGYEYDYLMNPDRIEAQDNGFNTEHTWPQSFFDQASPMRTDIHHLFITRADVNGARSNFKFDEIDDAQTDRWYYLDQNQTSIPSSNIDDYSELKSNTSFEPREDHKGNVARAIFYFWTVYQQNSDIINDGTDNEAFFNSMKDVLLSWHLEDEVDEAEIQRSLNVETVQGNRNPFIHDTTLVRRAYFGAGPVVITSNEEEMFPKEFSLEQNYPNPFNPSTNIAFTIARSGLVQVNVYNALGQSVTELANKVFNAGSHELRFDATNLPSGLYYYRIQYVGVSETRAMTLIK